MMYYVVIKFHNCVFLFLIFVSIIFVVKDSIKMDLGSFISSKGCECLNESDEHTLEHGLSSKGGYLESDCDEQVIIHY
jgi:hypothetical protein